MQAVRALCDHLTERTASLFWGPTINAGLVDTNGAAFPSEAQLSALICAKLLESPGVELPLADAAEIAKHRVGSKELNAFVYDRFSAFSPGVAHSLASHLPWDVIYTTNYDILLELASSTPAAAPTGTIRPIWAMQTEIESLEETDIPYYKLHGSIDHANTPQGRLILTREDQQYYEQNRKPLLSRQKRDLASRVFLFLGYSADDTFRKVLHDCREELGITAFPLSYMLRRGASPLEEAFWRDKYNIQILDIDTLEFLTILKDTWDGQGKTVVPFEERRQKRLLTLGQFTSFPKIGTSFYEIRVSDCAGTSEPQQFFRGAVPTWPDIRDGVAPSRDVFWTMLDYVFQEVDNPRQPASAHLITGAAGTGKTTVARQLLWSLVANFGELVRCLEHVPSTPFELNALGQLIDPTSPKRIVIFIRNAADYGQQTLQFLHDLRARKLPVTLLLEERKNQWSTVTSSTKLPSVTGEFSLGQLSQPEIEEILGALRRHEALGKLAGVPFQQQVDHFAALAHKDLLVALRELTTGNSFDDIVRDEFRKIPSEIAQKAYVYTAAVGQVDLAIRYETILRLLNLRFDDARKVVFAPTEGVLITHDDAGRSRHNIGFQLRARHPIIASIIFDTAAPTDEAKFAVFTELLTELDPGFIEDRRLLEQMIFRRELLSTIASPDRRRAIFERLAKILPNNAAVLQHRSILERELNDPTRAIQYAKDAVRIEPRNAAMLNTLGLAYERAARGETSEQQRRSYLTQAAKLFEDGIRRDDSNAYGWIGKAALLKGEIERESDASRRAELRSDLIALLEDGLDASGGAHQLAGELAEQQRKLGDSEQAIDILRNALKVKKTNSRLWEQLARLLYEKGDVDQALSVAAEGLNYDPTAWRLHRHVARFRRALGEKVDAVVASYKSAIRYHQADNAMRVELGAYLFSAGRYDEAQDVFREAESKSASSRRRDISERWYSAPGRERIFNGKISKIRGAIGFVMAIPENFEAVFWRTESGVSDLKQGDSVRFRVLFSIKGASAKIIKQS